MSYTAYSSPWCKQADGKWCVPQALSMHPSEVDPSQKWAQFGLSLAYVATFTTLNHIHSNNPFMPLNPAFKCPSSTGMLLHLPQEKTSRGRLLGIRYFNIVMVRPPSCPLSSCCPFVCPPGKPPSTLRFHSASIPLQLRRVCVQLV